MVEDNPEWNKEVSEVQVRQEQETKLLVKKGYKLIFDTIAKLDLPVSNSPGSPEPPFSEFKISNIKFVGFSSSDPRIEPFKKYFALTEYWQVGIFDFKDSPEQLTGGRIFHMRSAQLIIQPVDMVISRTLYEIEYHYMEGQGYEDKDKEDKSSRTLTVYGTDKIVMENGLYVDYDGPENLPSELEFIHLLNSLALLYAEEVKSQKIGTLSNVDPPLVFTN